MDEHTQKLAAYISQQLQVGQTPEEISAQLQNSGWSAAMVHGAFLAVQGQIMPQENQSPAAPQDVKASQAAQAPAHQETPQAFGRRRGRIRAGWVLLKQSMKLLNGNRYLLRYLLMTWVVIMVAEIILFLVAFFGYRLISGADGSDNAQWYVLVFVSYLIIYFLINFYAAALASNIFDIFQGKRQPYQVYVGAARAKAWPIFVFSVIESIVGMILRYVVERIRFVGWIVSWLLGTVWSLGTMFVLPIIMDTDTSAPAAIKQSVRFFKQTWGENVVAKATVNTPLGLITLALALAFWPVWFVVIFSSSLWLAWLVLIVYLFIQITIAIIGSFANSTINVALYYYAAKHQVPPAFSADMLNRVFIERKHFKKKSLGPHGTV